MSNNHLIELLKLEAKELNHFFKKASLEGKGTPTEVSDRREIALTAFLQKYFPFPYRIGKGNIWDSYDKRSASIDCVLLNPAHPYTTTNDGKYSIILADGVDAAIELKPDLNSKDEIERALSQISSVKQLTRRNVGVFNLPIGASSKEYLENCKKIPGIIFYNSCYADKNLLFETIVSYYETNKILREFQFDFIVVNEQFIMVNIKKDFEPKITNLSEGLHILEYGESTLGAFLLFLNLLPHSQIKVAENFLKYYLDVRFTNDYFNQDINNRLLGIN